MLLGGGEWVYGNSVLCTEYFCKRKTLLKNKSTNFKKWTKWLSKNLSLII